jgi:hypothetical protein
MHRHTRTGTSTGAIRGIQVYRYTGIQIQVRRLILKRLQAADPSWFHSPTSSKEADEPKDPDWYPNKLQLSL